MCFFSQKKRERQEECQTKKRDVSILKSISAVQNANDLEQLENHRALLSPEVKTRGCKPERGCFSRCRNDGSSNSPLFENPTAGCL